MLTELDGEGIGRADLVQNTRNLLTVVTTVAGSFVTSWGNICCSKNTILHAGSPLVSQSVKQSVSQSDRQSDRQTDTTETSICRTALCFVTWFTLPGTEGAWQNRTCHRNHDSYVTPDSAAPITKLQTKLHSASCTFVDVWDWTKNTDSNAKSPKNYIYIYNYIQLLP